MFIMCFALGNWLRDVVMVVVGGWGGGVTKIKKGDNPVLNKRSDC